MLLEKTRKRTHREKPDVRRAPRLRAPEVVASRLPESEEHVGAVAPVRAVGDGDDQQPTRREHSASLDHRKLRLEKVLQHFDAYDHVEGVVRKRKCGRIGDLLRVETLIAGPCDRFCGDIYADVARRMDGQEGAARPSIAAAEVETGISWLDHAAVEPGDLRWSLASQWLVATRTPVSLVIGQDPGEFKAAP